MLKKQYLVIYLVFQLIFSHLLIKDTVNPLTS